MTVEDKKNIIINYLDIIKNIIKYSFCFKKRETDTKVLLKFDDLADCSRKVIRIDIVVRLLKVKILWGIIGKSLENPDKKYVEFLKKRKSSPYYRFFNHGYLHLMGSEYEFENKTKEEQKESVEKTQKTVFEKTGILLDTFAAPCNHIDPNTSYALNEIPGIKYFLFGSQRFNGRNFIKSLTMENGVGNIDFEFFKSQWKNRDEKHKIITLQGHPYAWNIEKLLIFVTIILFLKSEGCKFIFPDEAD